MAERNGIGADAQRAIDWLRAQRWAFAPHAKGTLLDHLVGTYALLRAADAPTPWQLAGLLHSVYGTSQYRNPVSIASRADIAALVGDAVEELVFGFSRTNRPQCFRLALAGKGSALDAALLTIECANLLEQRAGQRFLGEIARATERGDFRCPPLFATLISCRLAIPLGKRVPVKCHA